MTDWHNLPLRQLQGSTKNFLFVILYWNFRNIIHDIIMYIFISADSFYQAPGGAPQPATPPPVPLKTKVNFHLMSIQNMKYDHFTAILKIKKATRHEISKD